MTGEFYFRNRLLRDLPRTNPAIVIDTVRDGYFFTNYPDFRPETSDLRSFPELYAIVSRDFEQVGGSARCAALYLRREKAAALRAAEIPLQSSVPALLDGSATEICDDDWWAPELPTAAVDLTVEPAQPVAELWILASRGGAMRDRGTTRVRITFTTAAGSKSVNVAQLHNYPVWTVVKLPDSAPIAKIEIESVEYVGRGPALAQIKAFNKEW